MTTGETISLAGVLVAVVALLFHIFDDTKTKRRVDKHGNKLRFADWLERVASCMLEAAESIRMKDSPPAPPAWLANSKWLAARDQYFTKRFMDNGDDAPIQIVTDLQP